MTHHSFLRHTVWRDRQLVVQSCSIHTALGHQVCTHLRRDFVPLLFTDPLQVNKVLRLTFGNSNLQLPPQIFCGIKVWRLARPLQDLNVLLLEPPLCCLGRVFWVVVMLEYPSTTHFQCLGWLQLPWLHCWFLTVLMIIETPRGEILHGAADCGRLTVILCLPTK